MKKKKSRITLRCTAALSLWWIWLRRWWQLIEKHDQISADRKQVQDWVQSEAMQSFTAYCCTSLTLCSDASLCEEAISYVLCEETVMGTVQGSTVIISIVNHFRQKECSGATHTSLHWSDFQTIIHGTSSVFALGGLTKTISTIKQHTPHTGIPSSQ